jgi:DNA-binding transcriptional regulator YdaS (Cro superfamily)
MRLGEWLDSQGDGAKTRLSRDLGVRWATVHDWARGESQPRLDMALEIERVTDGAVRVADLIRDPAPTGTDGGD